MALLRPRLMSPILSLLGVKRTSIGRVKIDVHDPKPTFETGLLQTFNDPNVSHSTVAKCLKGLLIGRAIVRRNRLF